MNLAKRTKFHLYVLKGCFRADLAAINRGFDSGENGPKYWLKFIFDVEVPTMQRIIVKVIKKISLTKTNQGLRKLLEDWLGKQAVETMGGKLDTDSLLGKTAEVVVCHIHNEEYPTPFVFVQSIHPVGSFDQLSLAE